MTDLQILVRQVTNPSILAMQKRLHDEVIKLGEIAKKLKDSNDDLQKISEVKESDWLKISQETDEIIANLRKENKELKQKYKIDGWQMVPICLSSKMREVLLNANEFTVGEIYIMLLASAPKFLESQGKP